MKLVNKILFVETLSDYYCPYQNWYFPLKKLCREIKSFDFRVNYLRYGKDVMNKKLLETVKREKPDFIMFWLSSDEFHPETFLKIREVSPKTKTLVFFGDDDCQFEIFSRYYALFFDYCFISQREYIDNYKREGIKSVFPATGINTENFRPLKTSKEYDTTFIGAPKFEKAGRFNFIRYLKNKGINIRLFGGGWGSYPEFRGIYGGPLSKEEMVKVINQTKINLSFSKNNYGELHFTGRVFEIGACKAFTLVEYFLDFSEMFKEEKEIIMFKDEQELLKKIRYFLEHEKEREKIAEAAYRRVLKDYSLDAQLATFFKQVFKEAKKFVHRPLPSLNKKITAVSEKDMKLSTEKLKKKLKDSDYISFKKGKVKYLKYKNYIQAYSLEKSGKEISCCDYYVYSRNLGDYLLINSDKSFRVLKKSEFLSFLNINQLVVAKNYFFENFEKFRGFFNNKKTDLISEKNTVFVYIPLIRIQEIGSGEYSAIRKAFAMKFLHKLYSLYHQKKLFSDKFLYFLLFEALKGKFFILKTLIDTLKDKDKWTKLHKFDKMN